MVQDLCNGGVSETIQYVTAFSGQTDAQEMRCDLTDRQIDKVNYSHPRCACAPRVNYTVRNLQVTIYEVLDSE